MKPVGQKSWWGVGIIVAVMYGAFAAGLRRSEAITMGAKQGQEQSLEDALSRVSRQTTTRLLVEIPDHQAGVTLNGASGRDALKEILGQTGLQRSDTAGITVLRPKSYAAVSKAEADYRASMQNLIAFLEGLSTEQRHALAAGHWLDAAHLSAEDQEKVRTALYDDAPDAQRWEAYKMRGKIAVTFLFDPYIEVLEGDGPGMKTFFLTQQNFPDFESLQASQAPGILNAGKTASKR